MVQIYFFDRFTSVKAIVLWTCMQIFIETIIKSISEVPREVLTSTDNNDDEVLETSAVTNQAQSALSGF